MQPLLPDVRSHCECWALHNADEGVGKRARAPPHFYTLLKLSRANNDCLRSAPQR